MTAAPPAVFDSIAASYDDLWTCKPAGVLQRQAVWRQVDPLIERGHRVLDLGCGTGEDAVHFAGLGASVLALDVSSGMVARAREKGANAHVMRAEDVGKMQGAFGLISFDLILANFGVLNCVRDLSHLREPLSRLVRPNGHLAICLMGRFCLWESGYYGFQGKFRKAARRWFGETKASLGLKVFYPLVRQVRDALSPDFDLCTDTGIGVCVPPSFVPALPAGLLRTFGRIDQRIAGMVAARIVADHRLLVFQRRQARREV
jgi:ubiquinone/menaquinone biosynthesis C-methylase UbiE